MGACSFNEVPRYSFASSLDRRFSKHIHDNVHGNIYLDELALKFIDTEQFQRLRSLKQLGLSHLVYPGATHSRFEHSLGVYWLAGEAIYKIQAHQGLELGIEYFDLETVRLAGLLHDIGHGPFSHLFEHEILPRILKGSKWSHEQMSTKMVDYIVDEHNIDIDSDVTKKVKEMIVASCQRKIAKTTTEKRFLYDIVANGRNGIDVDKFDYIIRDSRACGLGCSFQFERLMETMRVIDDEICYRAKDYLTIHKLFATRADLHRTVYTHAKVKAIEIMLVDALIKANVYLHIPFYVDDPAEYWKIDDTIVNTIETSRVPELEESRDIIQRIRRRNLYQFCNEFSVPKDWLEHFKDVTPQDIICCQKNGSTLSEDDVAVSNVKIDFTRGNVSPLERYLSWKLLVFSYSLPHSSAPLISHQPPASNFSSNEKFPIQDERISHLLPVCCQDKIVRVYSKKPELVEQISEAFENFQLRQYGMKAQVHSTPEKKKRRK